jgi:hypothetical protein
MDVHKGSISIAVMNSLGRVMMACVIEAEANIILDFIHELRGELRVPFVEGTWATWWYDLQVARNENGGLRSAEQRQARQQARPDRCT